jgi:hypothetical protein
MAHNMAVCSELAETQLSQDTVRVHGTFIVSHTTTYLASLNKSEPLLCRIVNHFDGGCPSILFRRANTWLRSGDFLTLNG